MSTDSTHSTAEDGETRRDFLYLTAGAFGAVGAGCFAWPFLKSLAPAADTLAVSTVEIDLAPIAEGQSVRKVWQGKPIFIKHRTAKEIATVREVPVDSLRDKQADDERVEKAEWLVVIGNCTHLGCIPLGTKATDPKGDFGGWFCPCHGSHYDASGRIRKGPAPKNLVVPPYKFSGDTTIVIG